MRTRQDVRKQDAILPPIRMYAEELAKIKEAANQAGESVAEYVRKRIFEPMERITEIAQEAERSVIRPLEQEERHAIPKPKSSARKRAS